MHEAKNTQRALVRIGYDGRVIKQFRGPKAAERYANECRVLKYLEYRDCDFVPRLLESNDESLELVTTNCGAIVQQLSDSKVKSIFAELEKFGVRHEDAYLRNITYRATDGRFCVIDFEFATILEGEIDAANGNASIEENSADSVQWSGYSHCGYHRSNNEDAFLALTWNNKQVHYLGKDGEGGLDDANFIFAVSDGMGGERSGEFASKISIEKITLMLPQFFLLPRSAFECQLEQIMTELFSAIHDSMTQLSRTDANCRDMGATLTLVCLRGDRCYFAHLGDSRLYFKSPGQPMDQISNDHSHVGWLRRSGKINEREARQHPRKNVLAQALGAGHRFISPQVGSIDLKTNDQLLLCTDGLIDGLWDRSIDEFLSTPKPSNSSATAAQQLVMESIAVGKDNSTALVLTIK